VAMSRAGGCGARVLGLLPAHNACGTVSVLAVRRVLAACPILPVASMATAAGDGNKRESIGDRLHSPAGRDGFTTSGKQADIQEAVTFDRNFITVIRAMRDFLLTTEDLKGLRVTTRRSPGEQAGEAPIKVYWRKDVSARALQVWGTAEALERERERRRLVAEAEAALRLGAVLKRLTGRRANKGGPSRLSRERWPVRSLRMDSGLESQSGRVVLAAVGINLANFVGKLVAWIFTGSHAVFSEAIHSAADTCNQLILAYGLKQSARKPNSSHPYGFAPMQYVSSLISGVGIFCMGAGLSVYHGVIGLVGAPAPMESLAIGFTVLGCSLVSESVTLALAIKSIRQSAASFNMSSAEFVLGGYDPCVNVVLLEDMAAVLGVLIAGGAMSLSVQTGSHIPDALGSIAIGGLLGAVATFMINTNAAALVGRSISEDKLALINKALEGDVMVRQVHDVKGIDMGNGVIRYKAEVDVDGRELARAYLRQQDAQALLADARAASASGAGELELFLLRHGEAIVETIGAEVDRIERNLKQSFPEIRHVDLEVL